MLLLLSACDSSDPASGCAGCTDGSGYPSPVPLGGDIRPNALVTHLQEDATDFLGSHLSDLLRANFPTRMAGTDERVQIYLEEGTVDGSVTMDIRDGCIGPTVPASCPDRTDPGDDTMGPTYPSKIELSLTHIDQMIDTVFVEGENGDPPGVRVALQDIDVYLDLAVVLDAGLLGTATCHVTDEDENVAAAHIDRIEFLVTAQVDVDNTLLVEVTDVQTEVGTFLDSDLLNLSVTPCNDPDGVCDDPTCHDGLLDIECTTYCGVGDFVFTVGSFLDDFLAPLVEWLGPALIEDLVGGMLEDINGTPLSASGEVDETTLVEEGGIPLDSLLMDPTALQLTIGPGPGAVEMEGTNTDRGLSLWLDAGSGAEPSPCVPTISVPYALAPVTTRPVFDGEVTGDWGTESYHLAMAVSQVLVEQAAFGMFQVGGECISASSVEVEEMTGGAVTLGALALLVPGLADLGDEEAPLIVQVHPTQAPRVVFGTGEPLSANSEIIDSLIQIDLGEVGLSVFSLIDGAMTRLLTISADVELDLTVVRTPDNGLELAIDRLFVGNFAEIYNELVGGEGLADLMEVTVGVMLEAAVAGIGDIDLDISSLVSDAMGSAPISIRINAVQRVGSGADAYLAAYLTFCDLQNPGGGASPCPVNPLPMPGVARLETAGPAASRWVDRGTVAVRTGSDREYQVRVDGGWWSRFRSATGDGWLRVTHPLLKVPGQHRIEVRGRTFRQYWDRERHSRVFVTWVNN